MDKFKYIQIVLFSFLILKESSTNSLQNEKKCSPPLQAQNEQFPYIVLVRIHSNGKILCQGTLIDVNWVITSAYCINSIGNIPLNSIDITIQNNKTHEIILKPRKVVETKYSDVALIEMEQSIITNSMMVTPIQLATEDLSNNTECIVASLQKQSNNDLSLIYWNVVNILKQKYDKSEWYLEDTICHSQIWNLLQNITGNGTPLICNNHLYGIYSINEPNLFNNILKYNSWINNIINPISSDKTKKYTANFVANYNSVSDTNSIVAKSITQIGTNNTSSSDTEDDQISSKPKSTQSSYTRKKSRSIMMYAEYTPISTESTEMEDMEITQSADPYSEDTEETPTYLTDITESDDPTSSVFSTQSYSSTTIIKSSITEKSTSNPNPLTSINRELSYQETEDTEETSDKPSSEPLTEETEKTKETEYTQETIETEETWDKPSSEPLTEETEITEETIETEETPDKSSSEPPISQSSTTEKFSTSPNPSTTIIGETGKTEITKYTQETIETEETWDKPSSEPLTEETEITEETIETEETPDKSSFETPVSQTTEKFTLNPNPLTAITEGTEYTKETEYTDETGYTEETEYTDETGYTEETEYTDKTGYTEETEYTEETKYTEETEYTEKTEYTEITEYTKETEYTEETMETEETPDKPSSETPIYQSSTTDKFTTSPNPLTTITGETKETEETEYTKETEYTDETGYTEETEYTYDNSDTPATQYSTTKVSTLNPKISTAITEETEATNDPHSELPSTHHSTTQSSTTKVSTLSPNRSTATIKETEGTDITKHDPLISSTTTTDRTNLTSQTDTSVTYYDNSTTTTIIPSNTTTNQSSLEPNTTLSDYDDNQNTTTTTIISTTTRIITAVTYDISDPKESSTFVDEQYQDKSSSQITSIHTSLITVLLCIVYHTNNL